MDREFSSSSLKNVSEDDDENDHGDDDIEVNGAKDIQHPGPHDVLLGRGGGTNNHTGNIKFRDLVSEHKLRYLACSKVDKPKIAREVVELWHKLDPPGRFLQKKDESPKGGKESKALWYEVGDKKAREKASQCLRERTPDVVPYISQLRKEQDKLTKERLTMVQHQLTQADAVTPDEGKNVREASSASPNLIVSMPDRPPALVDKFMNRRGSMPAVGVSGPVTPTNSIQMQSRRTSMPPVTSNRQVQQGLSMEHLMARQQQVLKDAYTVIERAGCVDPNVNASFMANMQMMNQQKQFMLERQAMMQQQYANFDGIPNMVPSNNNVMASLPNQNIAAQNNVIAPHQQNQNQLLMRSNSVGRGNLLAAHQNNIMSQQNQLLMRSKSLGQGHLMANINNNNVMAAQHNQLMQSNSIGRQAQAQHNQLLQSNSMGNQAQPQQNRLMQSVSMGNQAQVQQYHLMNSVGNQGQVNNGMNSNSIRNQVQAQNSHLINSNSCGNQGHVQHNYPMNSNSIGNQGHVQHNQLMNSNSMGQPNSMSTHPMNNNNLFDEVNHQSSTEILQRGSPQEVLQSPYRRREAFTSQHGQALHDQNSPIPSNIQVTLNCDEDDLEPLPFVDSEPIPLSNIPDVAVSAAFSDPPRVTPGEEKSDAPGHAHNQNQNHNNLNQNFESPSSPQYADEYIDLQPLPLDDEPSRTNNEKRRRKGKRSIMKRFDEKGNDAESPSKTVQEYRKTLEDYISNHQISTNVDIDDDVTDDGFGIDGVDASDWIQQALHDSADLSMNNNNDKKGDGGGGGGSGRLLRDEASRKSFTSMGTTGSSAMSIALSDMEESADDLSNEDDLSIGDRRMSGNRSILSELTDFSELDCL